MKTQNTHLVTNLNVLYDLHLYEQVLLFLGVFLFLILSSALIYYIIKKEEIKKLLFFFPIPIIMIGYPSLKEISISKDKFELTKYQKEYIKNPTDTVAFKKIEQLTEKLESRAHTEEDLAQISKSNILLGNPEKAIQTANKILENNNNEKSDVSSSEFQMEAQQIKFLANIQQKKIEDSSNTHIKKILDSAKLNPELLKISDVLYFQNNNIKSNKKNKIAK